MCHDGYGNEGNKTFHAVRQRRTDGLRRASDRWMIHRTQMAHPYILCTPFASIDEMSMAKNICNALNVLNNVPISGLSHISIAAMTQLNLACKILLIQLPSHDVVPPKKPIE